MSVCVRVCTVRMTVSIDLCCPFVCTSCEQFGRNCACNPSSFAVCFDIHIFRVSFVLFHSCRPHSNKSGHKMWTKCNKKKQKTRAKTARCFVRVKITTHSYDHISMRWSSPTFQRSCSVQNINTKAERKKRELKRRSHVREKNEMRFSIHAIDEYHNFS